MDGLDEETGAAGHPGGDLSLQEAAALYDVSVGTLRNRARWGRLPAYKVRGRWGHEWRVSERALAASGLRRRRDRPGVDDGVGQVADLERQLTAVRRSLVTERSRGDQANRELGQLMLECGRLRAALARAQSGADEAGAGSRERAG